MPKNDNRVCTYCGEEINKDQKYTMLAVEHPYYNLFFHRECYKTLLFEVKTWDGLVLYLSKTFEMWYN